jgi:hypothetical protein
MGRSPFSICLFHYTNQLFFVNGPKETARTDPGGYAFLCTAYSPVIRFAKAKMPFGNSTKSPLS